MTSTWVRSALALAAALVAAGIAALLLHLPLPGAAEGPPSVAGLVSSLKPVVIFGWPAAIAAILLAPRLSLLSSLLYWLVAGIAIGAAGLHFLKNGQLAAFHEASSLFELAKFGVAGALGGLVYWLFAGRSAAAGADNGSSFGLGNLALASLIGLLPPLLLSSAPDNLLKTAKTEVQSPAPVPVAPPPAAAPAAVQPSAPPAAASAPDKKPADDQKRVTDDAAKRKADEDKRLAEEAAKRKAVEEKRLAEEAAKKKADDDKRLAEEAAKRKVAEEKRRAEEAAKKKTEEEKRVAEEAAKRKAEEEKQLADAAAKSKSDEQNRRAEASKSAVQTACASNLKLLLSSKLIRFGLNSAALDSDAAVFVGRLAERLKSCTDFKLIVGGYSDTSGSSARNLEVSTARAEAVKAALVAGGVGAERVTVRGYGSSLPAAGGNEARAETPGRKAVIALFDTATPAAAPLLGATESGASPAAAPCSADAGKVLLSETLYFSSGSLTVKGDQRRVLKQLAQFAKRCDNVRVTITGHTDNVGSAAVNEELAQGRADRVARFLARLGAPKVRIVTNGLGSARPVDTNDTPAGRARNRRVVIGFEPA